MIAALPNFMWFWDSYITKFLYPVMCYFIWRRSSQCTFEILTDQGCCSSDFFFFSWARRVHTSVLVTWHHRISRAFDILIQRGCCIQWSIYMDAQFTYTSFSDRSIVVFYVPLRFLYNKVAISSDIFFLLFSGARSAHTCVLMTTALSNFLCFWNCYTAKLLHPVIFWRVFMGAMYTYRHFSDRSIN